MHCTKKITGDLTWVGANDRRLAMFEGVYSVPAGVSYNSYLLIDEKTVLFDAVDKAVQRRFLENVKAVLGSGNLDYIVVQHMEPDHSAALNDILNLYPGVIVVCSEKTYVLIKQFYDFEIDSRVRIVKENDTLDTGRHSLKFIMAPMVHWPEVMVTFDTTDGILFSADAFGCFGALNGALFSDEVDFDRDYMDEARRYYTNIVGKYGYQTAALLNKTSGLGVKMICPLHGFVWRDKIDGIVSKYELWSAYEPEENGVMIAYASVYGNTENAAEILACSLRDAGVKTVMYDVSVTPSSYIVSEAFRWSHLAFASTTYNMGIFVTMEAVINDLTAHNIRNRTVAIIENGSWAPASGGLIRQKLSECANMRILENAVSVKSGVKAEQLAEIGALADSIVASLTGRNENAASFNSSGAEAAQASAVNPGGEIDKKTMFKLSYGMFVLTAKNGNKDNGCIINTVTQISESPFRISIAVNKANYTRDLIMETGVFNVSILDESAPFGVFELFGFQSGRNADKFAGPGGISRTTNGVAYVPEHVNGVISAKVAETVDNGSHTLFIADVTVAFILSGEPSATYQYYFDHIKPKPKPAENAKAGYVCKICGYFYEGETLPDDFICPLCKHGAGDFERVG